MTLFSSGVGFFEHAGTVHGDASAELHFTAAQINDVLKSLTLRDLDGGKVAAVTYPSQDPIAKTLRSFEVDITTNPGMPALLNQLRGSRVTVSVQAERLSGTILGVESREHEGEKGPVPIPTLNLLTGATIRSIELPTITSLTLDDPQLQTELTKALAALAQARDQDKKPVVINFTGTGDRRVRVGYVVETPIWKASYRLMMNGASAHLQGWAIVENQTESDWKNVTLSLVSGRPVSFVMDLYSPLYLKRPTVALHLYQGLQSEMYVDGIPSMSPNGKANFRAPRDEVTTKQSLPANRIADMNGMGVQGGVAGGSGPVTSAAQTARLGALFHYAIPDVTLTRQKSALIPIVTDSVAIERVSIYNANVLADHPLNGVRLRNTTGKDLMQGPITVLDHNAYAGDARIEDLPSGQSRLLSYGVDLAVLVDARPYSRPSAIVTAKIVKGSLLLQRKNVGTFDYRIENKGKVDKTIIIETPRLSDWKLADGSAKPVETTPDLYRFEQQVAAGKTSTLSASQEFIRQEAQGILPTNTDQLLIYSRTGEIPTAVRDAIAKAITMKQQLADLDAQIAAQDSSLSLISTEQGRIRENMNTVDRTSQYYTRLLTKLNDQETTIEHLQQQKADLVARRDAQRKALEDYLAGLTVG